MISGTNPILAKLYNWLARNRSSVGYNVSQTVNPVVDVADLWPKTPVIRDSTAVLPIGGYSQIVIWDGTNSGASGGPYHAMAHRLCITVNVVAVNVSVVLLLLEPDTNKIIVFYVATIASIKDVPLTDLRDIYVPPGWSLCLNCYGTLGDTVVLTSLLSIANRVEPLPRGI